MLIRTAREVALLVKDTRRATGMTQAELAERVRASREWVRLLESGKPRLELGLTLRALSALGITLDARAPAPTSSVPGKPVGGSARARKEHRHG